LWYSGERRDRNYKKVTYINYHTWKKYTLLLPGEGPGMRAKNEQKD